MSKFTKSITRTFQFQGNEVMIVMDRMKRKDAMKLMPYIGEPTKDENGETVVKMKFQDQMQMLDACGDMLPKYIKRINGLLDADGNEIDKDTFCDESYFMELQGEAIQELMNASFMASADEKKSESAPSSTSQKSEIQASFASEA